MSDDESVSEATEQDWRDFFGFSDPYPAQSDVIEAAIETGERHGFLAMEGPCGTGKTMAALTAAAHLIRNGEYENCLVVTPVKQQLEQFVSDLRVMNQGLEEPLNGVSLVGKADLCPYERAGAFPDDVSVHDRCEDLREHTASLVETGSEPTDGSITPVVEAAVRLGRDTEERWWDPAIGHTLIENARVDRLEDGLRTAGATAPYPRSQPTAPEQFGGDQLYCPYEADWYARDKGSAVGFEHGENHVVTARDLLPVAVERGTCPHRAMGVLLQAADVVIGNYNHVFDPQTRLFTAPILDDRTFVIVDEAHRIEDRVRNLLSDTVGRHSLRHARGDLETLVRYGRQRDANMQAVEDRLTAYEVPFEAIERGVEFYDDVIDWLEGRVETHFLEEFDQYSAAFGESTLPEHDLEIPLRDPEIDEPDELTRWAEQNGYDGGVWRSLGVIGSAVEGVLDELETDRQCACTAVGTVLSRWWQADHRTYLREITLRYAPKEYGEYDYAWEHVFTPSLTLYNCMPSDRLAEIFDELGGGVVMSATLEPLDVFRDVSGLSRLSDDRPVEERTYPMRFSPEHRASMAVAATPFTARNRGDPVVENTNQTREEYAYVLRTIANSHGNVMLCLPNYREAKWAAVRLREEIEKPVLLDESSSNEETDALKQVFFDDEHRVLVTSTRGTLTEGVDYDGDKLHACAVVGVPLVNVGSPRIAAVRHAYAHRFGDENAFEYALTVPAVRRARQAIGRVIRGPEEVGVRVLVDERYTDTARYNGVNQYLSPQERAEFRRMTPMFLEQQLEAFWDEKRP